MQPGGAFGVPIGTGLTQFFTNTNDFPMMAQIVSYWGIRLFPSLGDGINIRCVAGLFTLNAFFFLAAHDLLRVEIIRPATLYDGSNANQFD